MECTWKWQRHTHGTVRYCTYCNLHNLQMKSETKPYPSVCPFIRTEQYVVQYVHLSRPSIGCFTKHLGRLPLSKPVKLLEEENWRWWILMAGFESEWVSLRSKGTEWVWDKRERRRVDKTRQVMSTYMNLQLERKQYPPSTFTTYKRNQTYLLEWGFYFLLPNGISKVVYWQNSSQEKVNSISSQHLIHSNSISTHIHTPISLELGACKDRKLLTAGPTYLFYRESTIPIPTYI